MSRDNRADSPSQNLGAVLQALFVTFLWSSSWLLIKVGLQDLPTVTFAGLRYGLAFVCLLPFALRQHDVAALRALPSRGWGRLIALGLLFYAVTQGAQFLGLALLPAVTVSLMLNFTTVAVALLGIALLAERPTGVQWGGVVLNLAGILIFFYPASLPSSQVVGIAIVLIGVLANAGSSLLGRRVNRDRTLSALAVTTVSMGVGAAALLVAGVLVQGVPHLQWKHWAIIAWLAVVNTAFAFTLWNRTLRTLTAMQSSIINSTMLVQIALLAWLFLDEQLSVQQVAGMVLAGAGVLVVQVWRRQEDGG